MSKPQLSSLPPPGPADLRLAICRKDPAAVTALLSAGADASQLYHKRTPLSWAQQHDSAVIVRALLSAGADANRASYDSLDRCEPPLVTAIRLGQRDTFTALLAAGADVNREDFYDKSPLWTAIWHRRFDMACQLVASGSGVNPCGGEGGGGGWQTCPLYLSARQPYASWRRLSLLLVLLGASPQCADADGRCALWWALHAGDWRLAGALAACGARLRRTAPQDSLPEIVVMLRLPKSLKQLCRTELRRIVMGSEAKGALPEKLGRLPLPPPLIGYLRLQEFSEAAEG